MAIPRDPRSKTKNTKAGTHVLTSLSWRYIGLIVSKMFSIESLQQTTVYTLLNRMLSSGGHIVYNRNGETDILVISKESDVKVIADDTNIPEILLYHWDVGMADMYSSQTIGNLVEEKPPFGRCCTHLGYHKV